MGEVCRTEGGLLNLERVNFLLSSPISFRTGALNPLGSQFGSGEEEDEEPKGQAEDLGGAQR